MEDDNMTDDATAAARQNWEAASAGWERNADLVIRTTSTLSHWLIEHLDPQPGEEFLELAAGPGDTGFAIARRIAPDGRLISTDLAPGMVAAAKRRAASVGITNAEFREMDAQRIDLPDGSVDGVVHRLGPFLLPDPAASAREVRRVLRDGGRYATASWGPMDRNPAMPVMAQTMMQLGFIPQAPPGDDGTGPSGMASMSDPAKVRAVLTDAGFTDITIEEVEVPFHFRGFDELWKFPTELAGPIGQVIKRMDDADRTRVKDAITAATEPFLEGGEYRFPAVALCFIAR
jgi:ubiquinone/menaquinone biosynthesis C-methylase UbiE